MKKKKNKFYKFIGVLEKNILVVKSVGLLPNCVLKKKKLYCNLGFVLQERGLEKNCSENCIAIPFLYCRRCQIVL